MQVQIFVCGCTWAQIGCYTSLSPKYIHYQLVWWTIALPQVCLRRYLLFGRQHWGDKKTLKCHMSDWYSVITQMCFSERAFIAEPLSHKQTCQEDPNDIGKCLKSEACCQQFTLAGHRCEHRQNHNALEMETVPVPMDCQVLESPKQWVAEDHVGLWFGPCFHGSESPLLCYSSSFCIYYRVY